MFIFQFVNDKTHTDVLFDIIVNFIIQKLKNKHTFLKKYTNWAKLSSLVLREQEETKNRYFAPVRTLLIAPLSFVVSMIQKKEFQPIVE